MIGTIRVSWSGKANSRRPTALLRPAFDHVVELCRTEARTVLIDVEDLEDINVVCGHALACFVESARAAGGDVQFQLDGHSRWQALTFEAMGADVSAEDAEEAVA